MFRTPLILKADTVPCQWIVAAPLIWRDPIFGTHEFPAGFRTDLASTPFHIDDDGDSRRSAVGHDYFYNLGQRYGKDYADAFLRAAIEADGGGRTRAWIYYTGVHLFGGWAWRAAAREPEGAHFETAAQYIAWKTSDRLLRG